MSKDETWQLRFEQWQNSSLSGMEFCRRENLSYSNFMRWKKKLSQATRSDFIVLADEPSLNFSVGGTAFSVDSSISIHNLSLIIGAAKLADQAC